MKRKIFSALFVLSMISVLSTSFFYVTAFASDGVIFSDDFSKDTAGSYTSAGPTAVWNSDRNTVSVTGAGWKPFGKDLTSDKSDKGKVIIEYDIVSTTDGKGFNFYVKCNSQVKNAANDIRNLNDTVLYAVLDKNEGTYAIYDAYGNEKSAAVAVDKNSPLQGFGFAMTTGAVIELNSIRVYECSDAPAVIGDADLNSVDVVLNVPVKNNIDIMDYISLKQGDIANVSVKDASKKIYTITLEQGLDYETENEIIISDMPLVDGTFANGSAVFKTRGRRVNIDATLNGGVLQSGSLGIDVNINNEFDSYENAVLVAQIYDDNCAGAPFLFDITTQTGIVTKSFDVSLVNDATRLEIYVVDDIDNMRLLSNKKVYGKDYFSEETTSCLENVNSVIVDYSFNPSNNIGNFIVALSDSQEDGDVFLKVCDKDAKPVYLGYGITSEGKKSFMVRFPQSEVAEEYVVYWGYNPTETEDAKCPLNIIYYPQNYVDACYELLVAIDKRAAQNYTDDEIGKLRGFAGSFAYTMNYNDEQLGRILSSVAALRDEKSGFADKSDALEVIKTAVFLTVEKNNDVAGFIELFNKKYCFDEKIYGLYSSFVTDDTRQAIEKRVFEEDVYCLGDVEDVFNRAVIFCGLNKSSHHMQVREILINIKHIVLFDAGSWNKYSEFNDTQKISVEDGIRAFNAQSYGELKVEFNSLVSKATYLGSTVSNGSAASSSSSSKSSGIKNSFSGSIADADNVHYSNSESTPESFSDMTGFEWAHDAVKFLINKKIVNGKSEKIFAPNDNIIRCELAKIIALAFELQSSGTESNFSDVSGDDWSKTYVDIVYQNEIITGETEDLFVPDGVVTREMMATVIYRVLMQRIDYSSIDMRHFSDESDISEYAREAVGMLGGSGIVNGSDDGSFLPQKKCTRAEAAVMIYRALSVK